LNSLYLRMICTKFYWNWLAGSGEENFKIISKFLLFRYYLPLGKEVVLHLYNSESSLPKDELCQLWLKLAQRFWRRSWKCKSLTDRRQKDRQTTDKRRSEKFTWAFSSGELIITQSIIFPQTRMSLFHWLTCATWLPSISLT
jgi:hypothetical protein